MPEKFAPYYSPGCENSNWASVSWYRLEPGQSGALLQTTNDYSTFYAEADDGAQWSVPYGVSSRSTHSVTGAGTSASIQASTWACGS